MTDKSEAVELVIEPTRPDKIAVRIETELTAEEILVIKEIARDRLAVSRMWGKGKNILLALAGVIVAYMTIADGLTKWIKSHLGL